MGDRFHPTLFFHSKSNPTRAPTSRRHATSSSSVVMAACLASKGRALVAACSQALDRFNPELIAARHIMQR
jgi:hypothetical protein